MVKSIIGSTVTALVLSSSLQAHTIAPDEIKQFAAQALHIDFDKAPDDVKKNISAEYTQRVKLAEAVVVKLKNDQEFIRLSETLALDLWSKRIANSINPTDGELKKVFNDARDLNVAPSYKLRHIAVTQESLADDLINQLKDKKGDEQNKLFASLAAAHSQDYNTKQSGGAIGWVDETALPPAVIGVLKGKEAGSIVKFAAAKEMWDIILLDEIRSEHPATFEEAKNYLANTMRQQAVETEAKKILAVKDTKPLTTGKKK